MVIEQYTVTTQRYNFPQPTMDSALPQRFLEQSIQSMSPARKLAFQLNQQGLQYLSVLENPSSIAFKPHPILLIPRNQETLIAAIDTSTIKIGETSSGIIIAIRGATVWRQNRQYRYTRIGPFIFHITEENKKFLYNSLEKAYFRSSLATSYQSTPTIAQMPTRMASLFERWMQISLSRTAENAVLLFDGSLTSGTIDTPVKRLREILELARRRGNTVLAFSKGTTLRVNGHLLTENLPKHEPPYLLETSNLKLNPPTVLLGDVYVARLSREKIAFRVDIDREILEAKRLEAMEKLIGNDTYQQSYPETLRLSHILCTFTANEVLAIQHFASRKFGLNIVNRPDMHRLLFGPFGRGDGHA